MEYPSSLIYASKMLWCPDNVANIAAIVLLLPGLKYYYLLFEAPVWLFEWSDGNKKTQFFWFFLSRCPTLSNIYRNIPQTKNVSWNLTPYIPQTAATFLARRGYFWAGKTWFRKNMIQEECWKMCSSWMDSVIVDYEK